MPLDIKTSEDKAHARYSASGSERWLNCPASLRLSDKAPPQPESKYATEGTEAHACFEFVLKNGVNPKTVAAASKLWKREMVDHAVDAATWVEGRFDAAAKRGPAFLMCETKVDASYFTCTGQFGTLDAAVIEEFGRLVIADYKYGAGIGVDPVDSEGNLNPQLVYYALGASKMYHHNFVDVELVVIQPRAFHPSGETTRSVVVPMDELLAWVPRFREGVMESNDKDAKTVAGKWCRFCPAATICPELKVNAMKQAQVVFSDEAGVESVPEPTMIRLPDLGTILSACDKLEAWIGKVREHAEHVLERGGTVDGWKLVQKRGQRKWKDEELAHFDAQQYYGDAAFSKPKLLTPAQLEKAIKGSAEWVQKNTQTESSGTTLARDADKRPAVTPASVVFAERPLLAAAVKEFKTAKIRKRKAK